MKKLFTLFVLSFVFQATYCQDEDPYIYKTDTLGAEKKVKVLGLPVVFASPETGFGFGGGAQLIFLKQADRYDSRISTMLASAIYTLNNQLMIEAMPEIYLKGGDYLIDGNVSFKIFPNKFWGVGKGTNEEAEEDYDMTSINVRAQFLKRLPPLLKFGLGFNYIQHDVTEVTEGGLLDQGDILGFDEARIVGLGIVFNFDSRNQIASPTEGFYFGMDTWFSSENMGATSSFNKFIADLRTYLPIGGKSVLAGQIYSESTFGDVPWQAMAWYGGGDRGRGYFRGRFMDKQMYVTQLEYRWKFHRRFTAAAFSTLGGVADVPDNLFKNAKYSYGGGLRFKFVKDQDTLLRIDFGFNDEGGSGFYFGVNEAF